MEQVEVGVILRGGGRGVLHSVKVDAWIGLLRVGAKFV